MNNYILRKDFKWLKKGSVIQHDYGDIYSGYYGDSGCLGFTKDYIDANPQLFLKEDDFFWTDELVMEFYKYAVNREGGSIIFLDRYLDGFKKTKTNE